MLFSSNWSSPHENPTSFDEIMLSAASTSNQHQPNFWFSGSPLPSFFSSSSSAAGATGSDKISYMQQPSANKALLDTSACSSSSEGSPPLCHDYLLSRSNSNVATTLNLTQFNYIQQNNNHNNNHLHPSIVTPSSNHFLHRDDWSQIPVAPPPSSNTPAWHPQHATKGKLFYFICSILLYARHRACSIPQS